MDEELTSDNAQPLLNIDRPGDLLRRAREARKMSLTDVAAITRIPMRQLQVVEDNQFTDLPGIPYALGFARAYARAVGADEVAVAHGVREELGAVDPGERYEAFIPIDPARVPPRLLAWTAAIIAALLAVTYGVWRAHFFSAPTDSELSALNNATPPQIVPDAGRPTARPTVPASGPVVLTATGDVWLRIYDQTGARLFERQMAKGESFTVPPTANNPMILTGRPDALAVTVGGRAVAPLGSADKTVADLPISATALLARPPASVAPAPSPPRVGTQQSNPSAAISGPAITPPLPTTQTQPDAPATPSSTSAGSPPVASRP
ncbi:MAG: RodZ domain-containing protein [Sphingobium sp.]